MKTNREIPPDGVTGAVIPAFRRITYLNLIPVLFRLTYSNSSFVNSEYNGSPASFRQASPPSKRSTKA